MAIAAAPPLDFYQKSWVVSDEWKHVMDTGRSLIALLTGKSSIPEGIQKSIGHAARTKGRIAEGARDVVNTILPGTWSDFVGNFIGRRGDEAMEWGYMGGAPRLSGMAKALGDTWSNARNGRYRDARNSIGEFTGHSPIGMVRDLLFDPITGGTNADYSNKGRTMRKIDGTS